jgi:hypothetical protein
MKDKQMVSRSSKTGQFVVHRSEKTAPRGVTYERAKVIAKTIDGALKRLASK